MKDSARWRSAAALSSRFLIIGALSTLIEIGVFNLLHYAFGVPIVWAKIIASLVALVNAYFGNREWAFKHRGKHGRRLEIALFLVVNGACTLLGAGILAVGAWTFPHGGPLVLNLINLFSIGIVVLVRFALYHWIVFPGARRAAAVAPPGG
jgi:Predicted membrane protein